ncbi:MAG TPA: Gfo/Idh/MocA family oxidoreductase [Chloroflexota bacterium]|nr:Gfo/Idh/MocA family oxidoreductase [Chloroflexota bacterium]
MEQRHRVRVCMVGCGGVSGSHLSAYQGHRLAELVSCVDVRREVAEAASRRYGAARAETSWEEAVARDDVDLVDVCLPHELHAPVAVAAARAGKHVFVEKPIANTLEEADAMIGAAREAGVRLMVDQTKRFEPRHQKIKELVDAGVIGRPLLAKSAYPQDITYAWDHMDAARKRTYWKHDGVISGIGIHTLDLLRWLLGEVESVAAVAGRSRLLGEDRRTEDSGIVLLRFKNGAIGESTVSYVLRDPRMAASWGLMPLQLFGEDGSIQMDMEDHIRVYSHRAARAHLEPAAPPTGRSEQTPGEVGLVPGLPALYGSVELQLRPPSGAPSRAPNGFAGAIDALLRALVEGREVPVPGEEGRTSLELVLAAYRALETGRTVTLPL